MPKAGSLTRFPHHRQSPARAMSTLRIAQGPAGRLQMKIKEGAARMSPNSSDDLTPPSVGAAAATFSRVLLLPPPSRRALCARLGGGTCEGATLSPNDGTGRDFSGKIKVRRAAAASNTKPERPRRTKPALSPLKSDCTLRTKEAILVQFTSWTNYFSRIAW